MLLSLTLMLGRWRSITASITRLIPIISTPLLRVRVLKARLLKTSLDKYLTTVLLSGIMVAVTIITIYSGKSCPRPEEVSLPVILQKTLKHVLEVSLNSKKPLLRPEQLNLVRDGPGWSEILQGN